MHIRTIAMAVATLGAATVLAAPASAQVVEGDPQARFYGGCSDNRVVFWVVSDGNPETTALPVQFEVDINYKPVKRALLFPGEFGSVHRTFHHNGKAKRVQVYADGRLLRTRIFKCAQR